MDQRELTFVIPTYRLRDVGETVEQYDQHFWRNGHAVRIVVFDDSSPANQEKYFPLLEQTRTHNDVYYVGPREKDQFLNYLNGRLHDARLEGLVRNLFRPSYGGNRNYTLMYTLGGLMVSSDDDMRPFALTENSLILQRGAVSDRAIVKIAQTFRSGTNDIDAIDFVDMFLADETQIDPDALNDLYVLVNFRPVVTNWNWRMEGLLQREARPADQGGGGERRVRR